MSKVHLKAHSHTVCGLVCCPAKVTSFEVTEKPWEVNCKGCYGEYVHRKVSMLQWMQYRSRNDVICSRCQMAREVETFEATYDDPFAQICNECKDGDVIRGCVAAMYTLAGRVLQIIREFRKKE
jgi:hypothetical protein